MKRFLITTFTLVSIFLCIGATTAPSADLTMTITDSVTKNCAIEFTLKIDVAKSSEPYASLEFNIVSSNSQKLHIIDLSEEVGKSNLDIEFSPEFGGVYHKGRIDETRGTISYLVCLFSMENGNPISEKTNVCTVRFRYESDSAEEILLKDLKLVYKNADNIIDSAKIETNQKQAISNELFLDLNNSENNTITYILITFVSILIFIIILRIVKRKKTTL